MPIITVLTRWFRSSRTAILILSLLAGILAVSSVPVLAGGFGVGEFSGGRQPSQERYLEITEISGTVTYENERLKAEGRPAKVGDRIAQPGEGIRTGANSSAKLAVDSAIGTVDAAENTNFQVKNLGNQRNGAKTTDLAMNQGKVRVRVRPFTNRQSRLTIQTPTSIAGVRGTEFVVIVLPNGETRVFGLDGEVEVAAQNQTQSVTGGSYSIVVPQKPPTPTAAISRNLRVGVQLLPAPDEGKVRVSGMVSPINSVFLNGQAIEISPTGEFNVVVTIPPSRRLRLTVRTPLDEEQVYELVVP